jgi:hypothetical protein
MAPALSARDLNRRSAIVAHMEATHTRVAGRWTRSEKQQADAWITEQYSWMNRKNRHRATSTGRGVALTA